MQKFIWVVVHLNCNKAVAVEKIVFVRAVNDCMIFNSELIEDYLMISHIIFVVII